MVKSLAFIRALPASSHLSTEQAEFSNQNSRSHSPKHATSIYFLQLLRTLTKISCLQWNTLVLETLVLEILVLEILYLLFRGINPSSLTVDQKKGNAWHQNFIWNNLSTCFV